MNLWTILQTQTDAILFSSENNLQHFMQITDM